MAQDFSVSGNVLDTNNAPLSFVNVLVYENEGENPLKGTTTDEDGSFVLKNLEAGTYIINFSYIGFEDKQQTCLLYTSPSPRD